jgi:DNA invertase Pin-like site-specific DNA recombinase
MRVGIYARVSTSDKDQDPETQLIPLREFCAAQTWIVEGEYVDKASATDLRGRAAWRRLLDRAATRHVDLILVWRMDRAFRSVLDAAQTLQHLREWKVGLRSYGEPWLDTSSAFGEALFHITCAYAQLERSLISERVRAGMQRAKKQGRRLGRPRVIDEEWAHVRPLIASGVLSQAAAARRLRVSQATISRLFRMGAGSGITPSPAK